MKAAAPFYGDIPEEDVLRKLKVPTLFIAGKKDAWINPEKRKLRSLGVPPPHPNSAHGRAQKPTLFKRLAGPGDVPDEAGAPPTSSAVSAQATK